MKKLYCDMHLFDLHQHMYLIDTEAHTTNCVAIFTADNFESTLRAMLEKYPEVEVVSVCSMHKDLVETTVDRYNNTKFASRIIEIEVL